MMRRLSLRLVLPVVAVVTTGCLATKSDIQLLQDEFRATRAQLAQGDTSILRTQEARRTEIARLSATVDRLQDTLRVLVARVASFEALANGQFDALSSQIGMVSERLGQTTRNLQDTRAQLQALREASSNATPSGPPGVVDTTRAPGGPGPATMFTSARQQLLQGAYHAARVSFDNLLTTYPTWDQAPAAQLSVAEAYKGEGNLPAADSVYQLVATKYPAAPEAATGLYRHGKSLWDAGKKVEARRVFDRIFKEYANSDEARQAKALLGER